MLGNICARSWGVLKGKASAVVAASFLALAPVVSHAVIDVSAATDAITTDGGLAITTVGGALIGLAGLAVVFKWVKAAIFG
jgi:hypothetical protein